MLLLMYLPRFGVALRKESVDRNLDAVQIVIVIMQSLSARRAWIEIINEVWANFSGFVALRKESVDRNIWVDKTQSAPRVALRKESVDRNLWWGVRKAVGSRRSPQGERG